MKFIGWTLLLCFGVGLATVAIIAIGPHAAALARNVNKAWARPVANVQPAPPPQPVAEPPQRITPEPVSPPQFIERRFFRFTWPNNDRRHDVRGQDGRNPRDPRSAAREREKAKSAKKAEEQSRDRFEKPKRRNPDARGQGNGGETKDGGKTK
jgi:hypothetical protein